MDGKNPSITKAVDVPKMGDLQFKCPLCCDKIFNSKPALVEHLANILDNIVCPICDSKWSSLAHLIKHLSVNNCQPENTSQTSELGAESESINHGEVKKTKQDPTDEGSDMGKMYVELLGKQLAKPCLQTQELTLVKDGDGSRYVLVTKEDSNMEPDGSCTVFTKQNNDGTISLTVEDHQNMKTEDMKTEVTQSGTGQEDQDSAEDEGQEIYSCNTCGVSFTSVLEHIQNYHNDQDVVVEERLDDAEASGNEMPLEYDMEEHLDEPGEDVSTDKKTSRRMITETGDIVEAPILKKSKARKVSQRQKQEVKDKFGRTFTRSVVSVDDPMEQAEKKKGPYHKVVIREMETIKGEKVKVFQCMSCNTYVSNLDDFKSKPCKQLKYTCPHCPVAYENHRSLCAHMKVHKIKPDFILDETMPVPPKDPTFECLVCNTVFQSHKSLKLHRRMHDPIKARPIEPPVEGVDGGEASRDQFLCSICEKLIPMDYRAIHVASHKKNLQEFHCDVCNKLFHTRAYLEMHMSVHSAEKARVDSEDKSLQYPCLYCTRRFARPHEKVKHERIHTGEKPHSCEICGKSFRVSYCLTLHMRTHTGARPYECQHCGKRFKAHSVYNHHLLTHSDVRAYKCSYCPKAFKTSVQLAGHKNSHTKPFTCRQCNRPFASLYAVRVHTETHNRQNNLKFACKLCGATYARAFALKDHVKQAHTDAIKADETKVAEQDGEWVTPDVINVTEHAQLEELPATAADVSVFA